MDKISNLKTIILKTLDSNKALDIVTINLEGKHNKADALEKCDASFIKSSNKNSSQNQFRSNGSGAGLAAGAVNTFSNQMQMNRLNKQMTNIQSRQLMNNYRSNLNRAPMFPVQQSPIFFLR